MKIELKKERHKYIERLFIAFHVVTVIWSYISFELWSVWHRSSTKLSNNNNLHFYNDRRKRMGLNQRQIETNSIYKERSTVNARKQMQKYASLIAICGTNDWRSDSVYNFMSIFNSSRSDFVWLLCEECMTRREVSVTHVRQLVIVKTKRKKNGSLFETKTQTQNENTKLKTICLKRTKKSKKWNEMHLIPSSHMLDVCILKMPRLYFLGCRSNYKRKKKLK